MLLPVTNSHYEFYARSPFIVTDRQPKALAGVGIDALFEARRCGAHIETLQAKGCASP